ncbi:MULTISPECIES: chorismate lyase [Undibacterium]|nr:MULTISPECIES: chorismate lyase [Undibacterium]
MPDLISMRRKGYAGWHRHVNAVQADFNMSDWLTDRNSLTARLIARSQSFRVQRLRQGRALCLPDEADAIALPRVQQVIEREVVLRCDETPVVYAHTVLPLTATASHWPLFASLGNRSLGTTLFSDPLVQRGQLQYARLWREHRLMKRIAAEYALPAECQFLWARRSVFRRKGSPLLVTEVFLPEILGLPQMKVANDEKTD